MPTKEQVEHRAIALFEGDNMNSRMCRGAFKQGATWANEQNRQEIAELVDGLHEARLQIEYLHGKFQQTGTGNAVLDKINRMLLKYY